MTLGGYDEGRFTEAPRDTVIFLSPFFRAVNLIELVIKFTKTNAVSWPTKEYQEQHYLASCGSDRQRRSLHFVPRKRYPLHNGTLYFWL